MTTYKQKYHLKKTQPLFSKKQQKINNLNYSKQYAKPLQKASTLKSLKNIQTVNTVTSSFLQKKSIKQRNIQNNNNNTDSNLTIMGEQKKNSYKEAHYKMTKNNLKNRIYTKNQQMQRQKYKYNQGVQYNQQQSRKENHKISLKNNVNIHQNNESIRDKLNGIINNQTINNFRSQSMSIVRKVDLLNAKSLQYWKKNPLQNIQSFNIVSKVQNLLNKIMKPDNGCICQQPCQWAIKLFKWVDIPQFLVNQHYNQLKDKIYEKLSVRNHQVFQDFISAGYEEVKQKNIEKEKSFKQIKKDIDRTHSDSQTFQNPIFKRRLQNILKCYVIEDIKVGYVQGMNMILAGIIYHVKQQAKTYGIFRKLLYSIRSIYLDNFKQCYIHINRIQQLLKHNLFDILQILQQMQIQLHMICLPWIISLLTSIVPLEYIHLIYYGFIKQKWNFIYKIILTNDGSQILTLLASSQDNFKQIDWEDIVNYCEKLDISVHSN